jgi:hypothetical protein
MKITVGDWAAGARYTYRSWLPHERRSEARTRCRERGRIAQLSDYQLAAYLENQAGVVDVSWAARTNYRAAWHEAIRVRGWSEDNNPRL